MAQPEAWNVYTDCAFDCESSKPQTWPDLPQRIAHRCDERGLNRFGLVLLNHLYALTANQALFLGEITLNDSCCGAVITLPTCSFNVQPLLNSFFGEQFFLSAYKFQDLGYSARLIELV
jgi:hypothetical protein